MIAKPEGSLIQPPAVSAAILPSFIDFGRETCCSLDVACDREWPVTNGIPLTADQQRAVVDACVRHLLTSYGLRSLAPGHANYQAHYRGGPRERDAAYHQGTVWGWLLGPFVQAHLRVYRDPIRAAAFLEPFANHLRTCGLGSASETSTGARPLLREGVSHKHGRLPNCCAPGQPRPLRQRRSANTSPPGANKRIELSARRRNTKINHARLQK